MKWVEMPVFRLTQVIHRPIEAVFAAVVDVANFPRWNPTTKSARRLSEGTTGNGTRFELEIAGFGKTIQELEEFEPNRRVRLVPHIKSLAGGHRFTFTAVGADTQVDHELEMTPRGFFKLMLPMMGIIGRKNLRATAAALKQFVERAGP
jgi:uncharacterized protein YndB with AHSA1/START domain